MDDKTYRTLLRMQSMGGGFAAALAEAAFRADSGNLAKLQAAFADLFERYEPVDPEPQDDPADDWMHGMRRA